MLEHLQVPTSHACNFLSLGTTCLGNLHYDEINFVHQVMLREIMVPSSRKQNLIAEGTNFQAEVFLREGDQSYDVMNWTEKDLIQNIIEQHERL
jgi:choline/glycine/proline betaine transport protein